MKDFAEKWQKSMSDAGITSFKDFTEKWQKSMSDANASAFKTVCRQLAKISQFFRDGTNECVWRNDEKIFRNLEFHVAKNPHNFLI